MRYDEEYVDSILLDNKDLSDRIDHLLAELEFKDKALIKLASNIKLLKSIIDSYEGNTISRDDFTKYLDKTDNRNED